MKEWFHISQFSSDPSGWIWFVDRNDWHFVSSITGTKTLITVISVFYEQYTLFTMNSQNILYDRLDLWENVFFFFFLYCTDTLRRIIVQAIICLWNQCRDTLNIWRVSDSLISSTFGLCLSKHYHMFIYNMYTCIYV